MKKLIFLFLAILSLQLQGQWFDYYPSYSDSYAKLRNNAMLVIRPTVFTGKKYPVVLFVHGMGERGPGTRASLENLVYGFSKNDGTANRWEPVITPDCQDAVNKYGIIVAAVNYSNSFSAGNVSETLDSLIKLYPIDEKRVLLVGFSLGGGTVLESILNPALAARLAGAVPIAPVGKSGNWSSVTNTNLPVWGAVNSGDKQSGGATDTNKIKAAINGINALKPQVPAVLTIFKADGHGGTDRMLSQASPAAPGGWYFTNATGNIYEWLLSMDSDNPKLPPGYGGNQLPTTPPPVVQQPTITPVIVREPLPATTTTGAINLIACRSTGADYINWTVISVPKGASLYSPYINGAGNCTTSAKFTVEGAYGIKTTACKGQTCVSDTFFVTFQKTTVPVPIVPFTYDSSTGYLVFSDGTRLMATATVNFSTKKVTVKDQAGITYTW